MDGASTEMPRYQCHKKVWALKIAAIVFDDWGTATITPADEGYAPFTVTPDWEPRFHGKEDLGYYVLYDDFYKSWSPSKAFEDGYARI